MKTIKYGELLRNETFYCRYEKMMKVNDTFAVNVCTNKNVIFDKNEIVAVEPPKKYSEKQVRKVPFVVYQERVGEEEENLQTLSAVKKYLKEVMEDEFSVYQVLNEDEEVMYDVEVSVKLKKRRE